MTSVKKRTKKKSSPSTAKDNKQIELIIPASSEYVGVARLAVSGVASRLDFTVEQVEDIKVAVTEACSNAVQYAYGKDRSGKTVDIVCKPRADHIEIIVKDKGSGFDVNHPPKPTKDDEHTHLGLGLTFMKTLMDDVKINSKKGEGTEIKLIKYISSGKSS
ncbi:ATP-binding protein [Candidatus Margulisiibacteriota bacterium]